MNRKHMARGLAIKAGSKDDGSFVGLGSVFGNVDSYLDIVAPGSFKRTLAEHAAKGTMPAMLWQHGQTMHGPEPIGVWTAMEETDEGLRVEGKLLDTTLGADVYKMLKAGALKGLSIGYITQKAAYDSKSDIRTILDVDLFEVSPVTFPANELATVDAVKAAIESPTDFERFLREAGLSRSDAKALMAGGFKALVTPRDAANDAVNDAVLKLTQAIRAAAKAA